MTTNAQSAPLLYLPRLQAVRRDQPMRGNLVRIKHDRLCGVLAAHVVDDEHLIHARKVVDADQ